MQGTRNPQEVTLSSDQMKNLMTLIMSQIQAAPQQNMDQIQSIISNLTQNTQYLEKKINYITNSLQQLNQTNQNEVREAVSEVYPIIGNEEAQKRIAKSADQELVDKFQNLPPVKKALVVSGLIGVAGAITPIAIAGVAIAVSVALVALPLVLLYIGLKRATPSKAEFKQSWQEMKSGLAHDIKNLANKGPSETNLEKLWKSAHKPGVAAKNLNLEPFLIKYCFPDQKQDGKIKIKFDPDRIEALKHVVKEVGLNLDQDIDRMVKKGNSVFSSDYVKTDKDGIDTKFIQTVNDVVTKVMAKDHLIEDKFESKLTEVKQTKAAEEAAKNESSFLGKVKNTFKRSPSHTEGVVAGREGSDNNLNRS